jgi:hypothetical protein
VHLVDLVLYLVALVAQVVLVVSERLRDRETADRCGTDDQCSDALATGRAGGSGRTVGRGAGEGAHGCNQSFGEVNSSTVSAPDQTLMYLRVSRSVGINVSAGPRIKMPGGTNPIRAST